MFRCHANWRQKMYSIVFLSAQLYRKSSHFYTNWSCVIKKNWSHTTIVKKQRTTVKCFKICGKVQIDVKAHDAMCFMGLKTTDMVFYCQKRTIDWNKKMSSSSMRISNHIHRTWIASFTVSATRPGSCIIKLPSDVNPCRTPLMALI